MTKIKWMCGYDVSQGFTPQDQGKSLPDPSMQSRVSALTRPSIQNRVSAFTRPFHDACVHIMRGILRHQKHVSMGCIMRYLNQHVYRGSVCVVACIAAQPNEGLLLQSYRSTNTHAPKVNRYTQVISSSGSILMQYYDVHRRMLNYGHHHQWHAYTVSIGQCRSLCRLASKEANDKTGNSDGNRAHELEAAWKMLATQMQLLHGVLAKGEALKALKASVDHLEPFADPSDLRFGAACLLLAQSLSFAKEKPEKYRSYAQRALRSYESLKGSMEHAQCLATLGFMYFDMYEFESALAHLEQCALVIQQVKGPVHSNYCNSLEFSLHQALGRAKAALGNIHGSLTHYKHIIRMGEKSMKPGYLQLAPCYLEAGIVSRRAKDLDGAMHLSLKAFNAYMTCYGPSSSQVAHARASLVGIYTDLGKYEDAVSEFEEARPILEYVGDTEAVALMNLDLAKFLVHQDRYHAAMPRVEEVIKSTGVTSTSHVTALIIAAKAYHELNKKEIAAEYCKKALEALEHQEASFLTAAYLVLVACRYEEQYAFGQAAVLLQKALKMLEKCHNDPEYTRLEVKVGQLLVGLGKRKEAIPYLESALSKREGLNGLELMYAHTYLGIADTQRRSEASKQYEACNSMLKPLLSVAMYNSLASMHHFFGIMGPLEHLCICISWFVTRIA